MSGMPQSAKDPMRMMNRPLTIHEAPFERSEINMFGERASLGRRGAHHRFAGVSRQPVNAWKNHRICGWPPAIACVTSRLGDDCKTPPMNADGIRPLIAGNWKMHGLRSNGAVLAGEIARRARRSQSTGLRCELVVCPPATLLAPLAEIVDNSPVRLGAQDCHHQPSGAYTGDVSAAMLADIGCRYVIVGHSERRTQHGESDDLVRAKAEAAHSAGL